MIGQTIRAFRGSKMSMNALAKKAEISQGYLSDIENGKKIPTDDILGRIADALGVPLLRLKGLSVVSLITTELQAKNMTLEQLASATGLKKTYIENLDTNPPWTEDYNAVQKIANELGMNTQKLMAALYLQEPPAYEGPILTAEDVFSDTYSLNEIVSELPDEAVKDLVQYASFLKTKYSKK